MTRRRAQHHASRARVVSEAFDCGDDPFNGKIRVVSGVPRDVYAYRLDILDCLGCPDDPDHRRRRRFASA